MSQEVICTGLSEYVNKNLVTRHSKADGSTVVWYIVKEEE